MIDNNEKDILGNADNLNPFSVGGTPGRLYMNGADIPARGQTKEMLACDSPAFSLESLENSSVEELGKSVLNAHGKRLNPPLTEEDLPNPLNAQSPLPSGGDFFELGRSLMQMELAGQKRGRMNVIDSLVNSEPRQVNEEVLEITLRQKDRSHAKWRGKVLEELNVGDWAIPNTFQINRRALALAWKRKYKETMPLDLGMTFSTEGHFSFGGPNTPTRKQPVGKHAGGQVQKRNKAKSKRRK